MSTLTVDLVIMVLSVGGAVCSFMAGRESGATRVWRHVMPLLADSRATLRSMQLEIATLRDENKRLRVTFGKVGP